MQDDADKDLPTGNDRMKAIPFLDPVCFFVFFLNAHARLM